MQQLNAARNKFQESGDCIEKQKSLEDRASVLVPLTSSMYVPGTIVNRDKFLIDIGTGYYVEKDTNSAQDFFARKVTFLNTQIEKYVRILQEKSFLRESEFLFDLKDLLSRDEAPIQILILILFSSGVMEVVHIKQQQMVANAAANSSAAASASPVAPAISN